MIQNDTLSPSWAGCPLNQKKETVSQFISCASRRWHVRKPLASSSLGHRTWLDLPFLDFRTSASAGLGYRWPLHDSASDSIFFSVADVYTKYPICERSLWARVWDCSSDKEAGPWKGSQAKGLGLNGENVTARQWWIWEFKMKSLQRQYSASYKCMKYT